MSCAKLSLAWTLIVIAGFYASSGSCANTFDVDLDQLREISPPPGRSITRSNLGRYRAIIDREIANLIADGQVTLKIGESLSFRPHEAYVHATAQYGGRAVLGEPGVLDNYHGGRPFPGTPNLDDARAGEKIAWNMRLLYNGDSGRIPEMHLQYRNLKTGKLDRAITLEAKSLRLMYRHVVPPIPSVNRNLQNSIGAFHMRAVSAGDLTGAEVLAFFNRDDTEPKRGWVYIPQLRRSQSLASFPPRETIFGSDILPDDFLGYSGRIIDMDWRFIGSTYVLLPMYRYDQITVTEQTASGTNYRFAHFDGQGSCFPNITWQLRRAYIVEGLPSIEDYPVSKRYMYVDAQTYYPLLTRLYDERGDLWKIAINGVAHPNSHMPQNHETGAPIIDSAVTVDLVAQRCTTVQLLVLTNVGDVSVKDFDPGALGERRRR